MPDTLVVTLTPEDQATLRRFIQQAKANGRTLTRARVLLKAGEGWSDAELMRAFDVCQKTVRRIRLRFAQGGLEAVLQEQHQSRRRQALTGEQAAHLIAIACTPAPAGHDHWTVRLLAGKAVELGFVESIAKDTIHRLLKKNDLKPWQHQQWCLPTVGAAFVAAMEDVLDLYAPPYDAQQPVVCFDEQFVLLHADARPAQPAAPGQPERRDYEYVRQGSTNLFIMVEPLVGWRHVDIRSRRTKQDYAACLRYLADERYPQATRIRLVQDNLNTHLVASLYETFPPAEARRLARRFEFHYTPKHASWLNMAEIEIGIFTQGCLRRRVPDEATLQERVGALEVERNAHQATIQ